MERRHGEPVGARFQVCGESAVVAEQQDAPALRGEASRTLHRHQRLPGARATRDTHPRKGAEQFENVELLLGEPHERSAFFRDGCGERWRQRHAWREQLHELCDGRRRQGSAGADRRCEHPVHGLVGPLQAVAVDHQPPGQFRSERIGRLGIREDHAPSERRHFGARPQVILQRVHRRLRLRSRRLDPMTRVAAGIPALLVAADLDAPLHLEPEEPPCRVDDEEVELPSRQRDPDPCVEGRCAGSERRSSRCGRWRSKAVKTLRSDSGVSASGRGGSIRGMDALYRGKGLDDCRGVYACQLAERESMMRW